MCFVYSLSIFFYTLSIKIAGLFNHKARLWTKGRKQWKRKLNKVSKRPLYWFHCASLGEFEQARPLIEKLKENDRQTGILITFFSPSGFEVKKNYNLADLVMYLPPDSISNAKYFVKTLNIKAAFFIKYEFWFNYLSELKKKQVPAYLIAGVFRNNQLFFRSYGNWFLKKLSTFHFFFVQNENSLKVLQQHGFTNAVVSGDTRYDKVYENAQKAKPVALVKTFKQNKQIIVVGSSWPAEELILCKFINEHNPEGWKYIIAPHKVDKAHIEEIKKRLRVNTVLFSEATTENAMQADVLIIDSIGQLSNLYQYGDIAFIGGAFRGALHNILEAATFSLPVIFGPEHQKFPEGQALINAGGAFSIKDYENFKNTFEQLAKSKEALTTSGEKARDFIKKQKGATTLILTHLIDIIKVT